MWAQLFLFVKNHMFEKQTEGQTAFSCLDRVACKLQVDRTGFHKREQAKGGKVGKEQK